MKRMLGRIVIRIFPLPRRATGEVLDTVAEQLAECGTDVAVVLDFRGTEHVDYRALRRFVHRMRSIRTLAGPVRLVGLNPYCRQIVRFALDAGDWELISQETGGMASAAPGGNGVARTRPLGRSVRGEAGAGALWWPISLN